MSDTQSDTRSGFRDIQNAHPFATEWMKECVHLRASAKPVSSAVLLLREVAPKSAGWPVSHVTGRTKFEKKVRRNVGNSPAHQLGAFRLALKSSIGEKPQTGRLNPRHSGSGTAGRKQGKAFSGLEQLEGSGPELVSTGMQAHRLICVGLAGHWAVIMLFLPYMSSKKLRSIPRWVFAN